MGELTEDSLHNFLFVHSLDFLSRAGRSAGDDEVVDEGALQQALPLNFLYDVNSG